MYLYRYMYKYRYMYLAIYLQKSFEECQTWSWAVQDFTRRLD